jgi:hypothetical protein
MRDDEPLMTECDCHGRRVAAAVCGHLVHNRRQPLGFIENSSDPNDLQGWCYACEYVFLQEEDKTEAFREFCNHAVVCSACYEEIKAFHSVAV